MNDRNRRAARRKEKRASIYSPCITQSTMSTQSPPRAYAMNNRINTFQSPTYLHPSSFTERKQSERTPHAKIQLISTKKINPAYCTLNEPTYIPNTASLQPTYAIDPRPSSFPPLFFSPPPSSFPPPRTFHLMNEHLSS